MPVEVAKIWIEITTRGSGVDDCMNTSGEAGISVSSALDIANGVDMETIAVAVGDLSSAGSSVDGSDSIASKFA